MMNLPTVQAPIHKRPLLLYLATNSYAIAALIAQEDGGGTEQPIYYISRALKDADSLPEGRESVPSHCLRFAEFASLFLGIRSMADD